MTFPLNEMYGHSRLCDRLRSSAIIWKQVSLRSSALRDRLRSFAIIWKPALTRLLIINNETLMNLTIKTQLDLFFGVT